MKIYQVFDPDGDCDFVEAETYAQAVAIWKAARKEELGEEWDEDDEPDSVTILSDKPVLRGTK